MVMEVKTFKVDTDQSAWLDRYGTPVSQQIREDLACLETLVDLTAKTLAGRFSRGEAGALCDVLNSTAIEPLPGLLRSLSLLIAHDIEDSLIDGLEEKWGIDGPALIAKIQALSPLEAYVVWHWVRRFWQSQQDAEDPDQFMCELFRVK